MNLSVKNPLTYVCARLCTMIMENVPEKELEDVIRQEELFNLIEKNIQEFITPKTYESKFQSVLKKVNDFYQSWKDHTHIDSDVENSASDISAHEYSCHKKDSKSFCRDVNTAAVKINSEYTVLFNKVMVKDNRLHKFKYVKADINRDKLIFVFFVNRAPGVLPIADRGTSGLGVYGRNTFFKGKTFVFEDGKKNMRLPYKFASEKILEIQLPPEK